MMWGHFSPEQMLEQKAKARCEGGHRGVRHDGQNAGTGAQNLTAGRELHHLVRAIVLDASPVMVWLKGCETAVRLRHCASARAESGGLWDGSGSGPTTTHTASAS